MTAAVTVDVAGGQAGGAARFREELDRYLSRARRDDVRVIGARRAVRLDWLLQREAGGSARSRRVATNNVGFVRPGGERWTLLRNALHFLSDDEQARLDPVLRAASQRKARLVRLAARRADVLVAPSTAMAERVIRILPDVRGRVVVRMHPVSPDAIPWLPREPAVLCPVLFGSYKKMTDRIRELIAAVDAIAPPQVRILITGGADEVPPSVAGHRRVTLVGQLRHADLCQLWARSQAIYFPSRLESFGYPLAEARVSGHPVIACDTEQSREIAGPALCGYQADDSESLRRAVALALAADNKPDPDPEPFDPDAYFDWLLGPRS
jgi:glycosyltransferase involved in cell wall biosynthesis